MWWLVPSHQQVHLGQAGATSVHIKRLASCPPAPQFTLYQMGKAAIERQAPYLAACVLIVDICCSCRCF